MANARVFKSGNSQAVRLPKQFHVKSNELEIERRGDELILREKPAGMQQALDILYSLPKGLGLKPRRDSKPQKRKGVIPSGVCGARNLPSMYARREFIAALKMRALGFYRTTPERGDEAEA